MILIECAFAALLWKKVARSVRSEARWRVEGVRG
jgi:hypothetical protein